MPIVRQAHFVTINAYSATRSEVLVVIDALAACPHHVPPPVAEIPDVAALCALRQRDIPAEVMEMETLALGYADPWVGTYGTLRVTLPESIAYTALTGVWGPGKQGMPIHWDDPPRFSWSGLAPDCHVFVDAPDGQVSALTVRDDRVAAP